MSVELKSAEQVVNACNDDWRERWRMDHEWHVAINAYTFPNLIGKADYPSFMYEAKSAKDEIRRLPYLFKMEREGNLPTEHQQCSRKAPVPIPKNELTCCLGVKCASCLHLKALEAAKITPEQLDQAKAWTCVTHVLMSGGDHAKEGYILTTSDRMYWENVYQSMASEPEVGPGEGGCFP